MRSSTVIITSNITQPWIKAAHEPDLGGDLAPLPRTASRHQGIKAPLRNTHYVRDVGVAGSNPVALHGRELFREGFTIEQVVRDYGDVCQAVTKFAIETGAPISVDEFRTFNRCLDSAITGAVTEYVRHIPVMKAAPRPKVRGVSRSS